MGIRMDQVIGLNDRAREFIKGCGLSHSSGKFESKEVAYSTRYDNHVKTTITVPVLEPCVLMEESGKTFEGMFDDVYPLHKYTLRDGIVYLERIQEEFWSSGPVILLDLIDKEGNWVEEFLWTEEEIESFI